MKGILAGSWRSRFTGLSSKDQDNFSNINVRRETSRNVASNSGSGVEDIAALLFERLGRRRFAFGGAGRFFLLFSEGLRGTRGLAREAVCAADQDHSEQQIELVLPQVLRRLMQR